VNLNLRLRGWRLRGRRLGGLIMPGLILGERGCCESGETGKYGNDRGFEHGGILNEKDEAVDSLCGAAALYEVDCGSATAGVQRRNVPQRPDTTRQP
jgi:hypothetical protein